MFSSETRRVFQGVGGEAEVPEVGEGAADEPVHGAQAVGAELQDLRVENIRLGTAA